MRKLLCLVSVTAVMAVMVGGCASNCKDDEARRPTAEDLVLADWSKPRQPCGGQQAQAPAPPPPAQHVASAGCVAPCPGDDFQQTTFNMRWEIVDGKECLVPAKGSYVQTSGQRTTKCPPGHPVFQIPESCVNPKDMMQPGMQMQQAQFNFPPIQVLPPRVATPVELENMKKEGVDINCGDCVQKWLMAHPN